MISSRFAICAAAAAVALSLSACSTVDLDKDKAGSILTELQLKKL